MSEMTHFKYAVISLRYRKKFFRRLTTWVESKLAQIYWDQNFAIKYWSLSHFNNLILKFSDTLAYEDQSFMTAMQSNFGSPEVLENYPPTLHHPTHHQYPYGPPPLMHAHEGQYLVPPGAYSPSGVPADPKDYSGLMPYHQDSWNNKAGDRQSPSAYDCYWGRAHRRSFFLFRSEGIL